MPDYKMSIASATRCVECLHPVNHCVCTKQDADFLEASLVAPEAHDRAVYEAQNKRYQRADDWFAEDRPLHAVQREERVDED
jgi:hypothetical protein